MREKNILPSPLPLARQKLVVIVAVRHNYANIFLNKKPKEFAKFTLGFANVIS